MIIGVVIVGLLMLLGLVMFCIKEPTETKKHRFKDDIPNREWEKQLDRVAEIQAQDLADTIDKEIVEDYLDRKKTDWIEDVFDGIEKDREEGRLPPKPELEEGREYWNCLDGKWPEPGTRTNCMSAAAVYYPHDHAISSLSGIWSENIETKIITKPNDTQSSSVSA